MSSSSHQFDVFLCHNGADKPAVRKIGQALRYRGLRPWLDEWELRPGMSWQNELGRQIQRIQSAAVFVGQGDLGPWHREEIEALLSEFVTRKCPVIPVVLADCEQRPELPVLLKTKTWVDFRTSDPDPLEQLIWGITGQKPDSGSGSRGSIDASIEPQFYLARPGSPMPESSTNRIERSWDKKIRLALDTAPFTAAVVGPPECGKSTFLGLMAAEAQRRRFSVVDFDARYLLSPDEPIERDKEEEVTEQFFSELAHDAATALGREDQEEHRKVDGRLTFFRFIRKIRLRRPAPPLLIIVDHASELQPALTDLVQLCRSLDAKKRSTQLSWAIAASSYSEKSKVGIISRLNPSPLIITSGFGVKETQNMSTAYGIIDPELIADLVSWFSGQPYLIHLALSLATDLLNTESGNLKAAWKRVISQVEACQSQFAQHLSRLKNGIWKRHPELKEKWASFTTIEEFKDRCEQDQILKSIALAEGILLQRQNESGDSTEFDIPRFYQLHLFSK